MRSQVFNMGNIGLNYLPLRAGKEKDMKLRLVRCLCLLLIFALIGGCASDDEQNDDIAFFIGAEAKIRNTKITIEGKSYKIDIVTLLFGMENMTSESQKIDISQNIQLIHPKMQTQQNAFKLLKDKKGPYIIHLKPKEKLVDVELKFIQTPGTLMLDDTVLVSVAGGHYIQKVELLRESE